MAKNTGPPVAKPPRQLRRLCCRVSAEEWCTTRRRSPYLQRFFHDSRISHETTGGAARWKLNPRAGKLNELEEARSRLYRRQILQVNIRWKALDEICKIYMLLHRSDLNISAIFRQFSGVFKVGNANSFDEIWLKFWMLNGAKACKSCRSRQELSNEYSVFTCKLRLRYSRERASESLPKISQKLE